MSDSAKRIQVKLPEELLERTDTCAQDYYLDRTDIIKIALVEFLQKKNYLKKEGSQNIEENE